jgi:hypothetical protein
MEDGSSSSAFTTLTPRFLGFRSRRITGGATDCVLRRKLLIVEDVSSNGCALLAGDAEDEEYVRHDVSRMTVLQWLCKRDLIFLTSRPCSVFILLTVKDYLHYVIAILRKLPGGLAD